MSKITGNDPANPLKHKVPAGTDATGAYFPEIEVTYPGLTIRQEFAARAMQGFLHTMIRTKNNLFDKGASYCLSTKKIAQISVEMADALIAELNKEV